LPIEVNDPRGLSRVIPIVFNSLPSPLLKPGQTASEVVDSVTTGRTSVATVDIKLEVVVIPVSDVDRAKNFYTKLGWRLDADFSFRSGRVLAPHRCAD
jgi:hypothetical protein